MSYTWQQRAEYMRDERDRLREELSTAREALNYVLDHHSDGKECLCDAARSVAASGLSLTTPSNRTAPREENV